MTATTGWTTRTREDLRRGSTIDVVCTLTLVLVALNANEDVALFLPAVAALAVGLVRPDWSRTPWWWLATAAVLGTRQLLDWEGVDNHVVVTTYWCLALGLGLLATDPVRTVARTSRLLIGLVFGIAVYWKLRSPDFASGEFFRFTLLFDDRFDHVTRWVVGLGVDDLDANRAAWAALAGGERDTVVALAGGPRLDLVAVAMAWFAIVVESAIAVAHLAPLRGRWQLARPITLLGFCLGTYLVVPVGGFGCLLATMALADDELPAPWRRAYVWLFAGLVLYGPVWWVLFG